MSKKKVYFAGSITGSRADCGIYYEIIQMISRYAEVLTEHVGSADLTHEGEVKKSPEYIYDRDLEWLRNSDLLIAEVTVPSLGVGYEIGYAESLNKEIVCLFRDNSGKELSPMIAGNKKLKIVHYNKVEELETIIDNIFNSK